MSHVTRNPEPTTFSVPLRTKPIIDFRASNEFPCQKGLTAKDCLNLTGGGLRDYSGTSFVAGGEST